jgi:hypothetical protein
LIRDTKIKAASCCSAVQNLVRGNLDQSLAIRQEELLRTAPGKESLRNIVGRSRRDGQGINGFQDGVLLPLDNPGD